MFRRIIITLYLGLLLKSTIGYSQDTLTSFKIDESLIDSFLHIDFRSFSFRCEPEFNFIYHSPDSGDHKIYQSYQYLINQLPTERNHKKYYELACALWELKKINQAEKMFLNIVGSQIKSYTNTYYHNSDIPGDSTTNLYGYGSFTSNYKNSACLYLTKIYIEKKKYKEAFVYLNSAIKRYKVYYTCGTGYNAQQDRYLFLKAACLEGLGKNRELVALMLPRAFDWNNPILINAIKKLYKQKEIKAYLTKAENSITCAVDTFLSYSYCTSNSGEKDEKTDTLKYYSGSGKIILFNRMIDLPYPYLEDGKTLTRDYYVKLFKESSFFRKLNGEEEIEESDQ